MTWVLIKREYCEIDMHTGRIPCGDEGRELLSLQPVLIADYSGDQALPLTC